MLPEIYDLWKKLETRRQDMLTLIDTLTPEQIRVRLEPDRWSILQILQHVVMGEKSVRRTEAELRNHPLRDVLQPGQMAQVVKDVLNNDVPVGVPDPSMEPDGQTTRSELLTTWGKERRAMGALLEAVTAENRDRVMFSHLAAGPLTAFQMLEIAVAHLDTHRRQIDRICTELPA